ncbi:MAG TPA: alpha-amylase, partial [Terriglobales bacterium]
GEDFVLKIYRKLEEGINPDREIEEFLTEQTDYAHVPRALGSLEYVGTVNDDSPPPRTTVGLLTSYVRNSTDGWMYTLDHLGLFFERALAISREDPRFRSLKAADPFSLIGHPLPPIINELLGGYAERARMVGEHLGNLHIALCSHPEMPDFAPEPFTEFYRHSVYHGMLARFNRTLDSLRSSLLQLTDTARADVRLLLEREMELRAGLVRLRDTRLGGARIRHHGNFHLGHLLFTGTDVMITNFEGDVSRPMSERRLKRSGIRDVAAMVRSFHYASHAVLYGHVPGIIAGRQSSPGLETWAQQWYQWVSAVFLEGYFRTTKSANFLPAGLNEREILFRAYLLEKALLEMDFEMLNRPDWIRIPVRGVLEQLDEKALFGQIAG